MPVEYRVEQSVDYGVLTDVAPGVRRIVARNPSPFTYHGTGTFIVGRGNVAVIDPGPLLVEHVDALLAGLAGERITHLLITHTHNDHSPATRLLQERVDVRSFGFGAHGEGRYGAGAEIEEGADRAFVPDVRVRDGEIIEGDGFAIECVHTPGHARNHMCFGLVLAGLPDQRVLFTGDHVMGWSTTVVSPPDGDMGDYLASLSRLLERDDQLLLPTHGRAIDQPKAFVQSLIDHRKERERQVLDCFAHGIERIGDMVARMYKDVPAWLHPAAARSVFAHVLHLIEQGVVACDGEPTLSAAYRKL